jgi:regulatory protein
MAFSRTKTYTIDAARQAIHRYCAFQERCQSEVQERLRSMGIVPEAQAELVSELISGDFLSEERFARAFARGKFRIKGWGPRKIIQGLQAKRVSSACIALGMSELNDEEVRTYLCRQRSKYHDDQQWIAWCLRKGYDLAAAKAAMAGED